MVVHLFLQIASEHLAVVTPKIESWVLISFNLDVWRFECGCCVVSLLCLLDRHAQVLACYVCVLA